MQPQRKRPIHTYAYPFSELKKNFKAWISAFLLGQGRPYPFLLVSGIIFISLALLVGLGSLLAGQSAPSGAALSDTAPGAPEILAEAAVDVVPKDNLPVVDTPRLPGDGDAVAAVESSPAVSPLWQQAVQEEIRQSEYHIRSKTGAAPDMAPVYQAPNRAQNFRIHFMADGVTLQPRTDVPYPWQWGLTLAAWGVRASCNRRRPLPFRSPGTGLPTSAGRWQSGTLTTNAAWSKVLPSRSRRSYLNPAWKKRGASF